MDPLGLIITNAGLAAFTQAQLDDQVNLGIATVGLTASSFVLAPTLTRLPGEFKRLSTVSGEVTGVDTIHMVVRDADAQTYSVRGFGLFLGDGTLFAVYGQPGVLVEKSSYSTTLLALDLRFPAKQVAEIRFGDTNFLNPPATEQVDGVARIASQPLVDAGEDDTRIVTPKKLTAFVRAALSALGDYIPLAQRAAVNGVATLGGTGKVPVDQLPAASATSAGIARRATQDLVDAGEDDDKFVSSKTLAQRLASFVPKSLRGQADGLASLDSEAKVPAAQIHTATSDQIRAGTGDAFVTPTGFASLSASFASTGEYQAAPGVFHKTGTLMGPFPEGAVNINFTTPFPNECRTIFITAINANSSTLRDLYPQRVSVSATGAVAFIQKAGSDGSSVDGFDWFAIGR